jgi:hypothetical protein
VPAVEALRRRRLAREERAPRILRVLTSEIVY